MSSTTLSIALPLSLSLIAVICTPSPSTRPVTSPVVETVARVGASLLHVTDRPASSLPAASLTIAVNCAVWPITTPGAAGVISTEATEARGDVESLLHATMVAPHNTRSRIACTCRPGRDMVPPPPVSEVGRIESRGLLAPGGEWDVVMALLLAVNSRGHGAGLAEVVAPAVHEAG